MHFDGLTVEAQDVPRLTTQFERVCALMFDGQPRTLSQIQRAVGGSEAAISARLRDLRKPRFGGYRVVRTRQGATHLYRVLPPLPDGQARLF